MTERQSQIAIPVAGPVTVIETEPVGEPAGWRFIYAPGAGSNVHDAFGRFACRELASRGVSCIRFQFPYQEASRRSPTAPLYLRQRGSPPPQR